MAAIQIDRVFVPGFGTACEAGLPECLKLDSFNLSEFVNLPSTQSPAMIQGVLRNHLNFSGLALADWSSETAVTDVTDRDATGRSNEWLRSITAGADMLLLPGHLLHPAVLEQMESSVQNTPALKLLVSQAATRVLAHKIAHKVSISSCDPCALSAVVPDNRLGVGAPTAGETSTFFGTVAKLVEAPRISSTDL